MDGEIIKIIAQGGSLTAIMFSLVFFLKAVKNLIETRKNGDLQKKIWEIENNHLKDIEERLFRLEDKVGILTERVAKIESKIYGKKGV